VFHTTKLQFLPIATEEPDTGRVWATLLTNSTGSPLQGSTPTPEDLIFEVDPIPGDPGVANLSSADPHLVAGLGIEMRTRRRNKFAGKVTAFERKPRENLTTLHIEVNEALGNCP